METKIVIDGMRFYAYHGVGEQERKVGNRFTVDLVLTADVRQAVRSDCLQDTVDYGAAYEVVKAEMGVPSALLEHVGGRILAALKGRFPQLTEVEVRVSKMCPPFGGDVGSASVILREKYTVGVE